MVSIKRTKLNNFKWSVKSKEESLEVSYHLVKFFYLKCEMLKSKLPQRRLIVLWRRCQSRKLLLISASNCHIKFDVTKRSSSFLFWSVQHRSLSMRGFVLFWDDVEKAKYCAYSGDFVIFRCRSEGCVSKKVRLQWRLDWGEMPWNGTVPRVWLREKSGNSVSLYSETEKPGHWAYINKYLEPLRAHGKKFLVDWPTVEINFQTLRFHTLTGGATVARDGMVCNLDFNDRSHCASLTLGRVTAGHTLFFLSTGYEVSQTTVSRKLLTNYLARARRQFFFLLVRRGTRQLTAESPFNVVLMSNL